MICPKSNTKKGGLFGDKIKEGYWVIQLDKEFPLHDGLNYMGELGYELVAIQQTWAIHGGEVSGGYYPSYLYIFKKPLEQQGDSDKGQGSSPGQI